MKYLGKILFWFFLIVAGFVFYDWDKAKTAGMEFNPLHSFGENVHFVVWEVWTGWSEAGEKEE
tara:strand:- start:532 stop:720 length:189 start_codon:yes stop_codon:yes gene_type:complete